jgi:hypothetical protein
VRRRLAAAVGLAAAALLAAAGVPAPDATGPLAVGAREVPLDPAHPDRISLGRLAYRGGLELRSSDPRFGGWSGLSVGDDGERFLAVSDEGHWMEGRLEYASDGRLSGVADVRLGPLLDTAGEPLAAKRDADAESLARLPDGSLLVGFERRHRIWRYAAGDPPFQGPAQPYPAPPGLEAAPVNSGLESLAWLGEGRLLALTEDLKVPGGVRGWVGGAGDWLPLAYPVEGLLRPSDATRLPSGDVLVLERGYSAATGVQVRIRQVPSRRIASQGTLEGPLLAELAPPLTVDNFEGIAARRANDGALIYVLSDDNFSPTERTLLLMFEAPGPPR